jgi:hypothetical protein
MCVCVTTAVCIHAAHTHLRQALTSAQGKLKSLLEEEKMELASVSLFLFDLGARNFSRAHPHHYASHMLFCAIIVANWR